MNTLQRYKKHLCGEHDNENTKDSYYTAAKQFIKYTNGIITPETIQDYQKHCKEIYDSIDSMRIKLNGMNIFLRYINLNYLCVKLPRASHTTRPTLTDGEITKMLEVSKHDEETHLIFLLLWEGMLRPDAIIYIKIHNRKDNILTIDHHKTIKHIGNKDIILSSEMQKAWDDYITVRPKSNKDQGQYLFICRNQPNKGNRYQSISTIEDRINKLAAISGIHKHVTPFMVRRTSGTLRQDIDSKYYAGDSKIVQLMYAHTSISQTMRYNNKTNKHIERYFERIHASDLQPEDSDTALDKSYKSPQNWFNVLDEDGGASFSFSVSFFKVINQNCDLEGFPRVGVRDFGISSNLGWGFDSLRSHMEVGCNEYKTIGNKCNPIFSGLCEHTIHNLTSTWMVV